MIRAVTFLVLAAWLTFVGLARGQAAPIPPAPTRHVTDTVGFLSPETRNRLDERLEQYERQTGHQVVVWIGDTIGDAALEDWAVRTFEAWGVGRKGLDDGLVMFVLAKDRKIDIEVGYGLEDRVPDAIASRVIREVMAPRLQAGDPNGAVDAGVSALLEAIEGHAFVPAPGPTTQPEARRGHELIWLGIVAAVFLVLFAVNPSLALTILWFIMRGGRGGGGGGDGGGFSGGGGRSGGGGARGGW
ncbi:TPM domain-containing protein [Polyangium jinanense]|uniref:TPM domain-containing protein n=1 Tax=Polyangium jinanense TaxID=2829994 RepID=A0A9X3X2Y1_9BACT|nr:TPM domain-containing protein [Polyangium jinanense]MDC3957337.1 TPM domain-containing protein [Polyangium jinanense]MDC3982739.1 TPM domain-containing protein [Polyangium jinanense]